MVGGMRHTLEAARHDGRFLRRPQTRACTVRRSVSSGPPFSGCSVARCRQWCNGWRRPRRDVIMTLVDFRKAWSLVASGSMIDKW